jgi:hypothetical protein
MFVFAKSAKERVVMAGVLVSLCLFLLFSVGLARMGGYALIFALVAGLIPAAIIKGVKLGYSSGRFVFGALSICIPGGIVNPFCYMDADAARTPYAPMVCGALLASAFFVFLFDCLGEHARLRNVKGESWFLPVSTRVLIWIVLGFLLLEIPGLVLAMIPGR